MRSAGREFPNTDISNSAIRAPWLDLKPIDRHGPGMLKIDTLIEDLRWEPMDLPGLAHRAIEAALNCLGLEGPSWEVVLLACDDARIAELNAEFRDRAVPTNVLSWPSEDRGAKEAGGDPRTPDGAMPELGDIAIAWETCVREAEEAGKPLSNHVTHLIVHGLLHLLGYDHVRDRDAALMERLEVEILGKLGVPDPY